MPLSTTPTTHIIKPQIGKVGEVDLSQSVQNEYLCLELVRGFGIPTADAEIVEFGDTQVLSVKRFDRLWTTDKRLLRVPQEDCCQALAIPPSRKYESKGGPSIRDVAKLLKASDRPEADLKTLFKSQIAFWLLGATDGHAKNFSIRLGSGGRYVLTPVYDVVSTQPGFDAKQIRRRAMKMAMSIGKKRHYHLDEVMHAHFLETAEISEIPTTVADLAIQEFLETGAQVIDKVIGQLPKDFPERIAKSIAKAGKNRLESLARTGSTE